ncbi:MAG: Ribulose-phosphate 3-epimerase [Parcubacteria group bacterium GW2011_GWB1_55_9]|nr:MAG: Ribulose-phosphate 3-epimerase [Parcubacteria group bacterium GW2011_GWB1_55_9]
MSLVVPAVLPSSRQELEEKLALFSRIPSVDRIQIDVVDGRFATPASWPYNAPTEQQHIIASGQTLPQFDRIEYEIDLMCVNAEEAAAAWLALGARSFVFHAESTTSLPRLLSSVRTRLGAGDGSMSGLVSYGIALNIASDLALIERSLGEVAYVQFMGIARIGRQGQPFDERVFEKVRVFRERHPAIPVQVDGGVSFGNAKKLIALGVSHLVVGSGILRAADPVAALNALEELRSPFGV